MKKDKSVRKKGVQSSAQKTTLRDRRFNFNFIEKAKPVGLASLILVVVCIFVLLDKGLNYGIDFAGGTEVQIQFNKPVGVEAIRTRVEKSGFKGALVQAFDADNEYLVRLATVKGKTDQETNALTNSMLQMLTKDFKSHFSDAEATIRRVDTVGPQIGDELKTNGLLAIVYCLIIILLYVGLRFDFKYALAAVLCLFHDTLITLGVFSLFAREVNVQTLAAVLTIIGYSLNDTIVTFDRVRENLQIYKRVSFSKILNNSLNAVLSRTLLTSITTLLSVVAMYIIAGGVIRDFAFTLGIGVIVGTYSSIFVASPIALLYYNLIEKPKDRLRVS